MLCPPPRAKLLLPGGLLPQRIHYLLVLFQAPLTIFEVVYVSRYVSSSTVYILKPARYCVVDLFILIKDLVRVENNRCVKTSAAFQI